MKIIIIKIGSSILLSKHNRFDEFRIAHIADQVFQLRKIAFGVILVISGAVAYGANFMDLSKNEFHQRRSAAGIGQVYLTAVFHQIFIKKKLQIAQILLTKDNFNTTSKKMSLIKVINHYLNSGVIPVLNENDVIDLNCFGGNDFLCMEIAKLCRAGHVLILSNREGSKYGVGGRRAKLEVERVLNGKNIKTDILDGEIRNVILNNTV